jgi:chromobox protein 5
LLRNYIEGKSPRSPPIVVVMEGEHEFVVDKILEHDFVKVSSKKTQLECLIKWKGYTDEQNTWEEMDSLTNCPDVVAKYKKEHIL